MDTYQFIKYNKKTTLNHLKKYFENNVILCFDFEDSIDNWVDFSQKNANKQSYRNLFIKIYNNQLQKININKIAIRLNNDSIELENDLRTFKGISVNSILFPKVEKISEIENLVKLLQKFNITYKEIIPIIESSVGISILYDLCDIDYINKIGFGHNDYNLSINIFPFFHQQSYEYWKWINKIQSILKNKNISFINSAFLELDNHNFFQSMIVHLKNKFGNNFGQFTLSSKQSKICNNISNIKNNTSLKKLLKERLNLFNDENIAKEYIRNYEFANNGKGFSILNPNRTIFSPQEYLAAKNCIKKSKKQHISLYFVGGCFPVQHNIVFEDLFHQKLRYKLDISKHTNLNLKIIRYERFSNCLEKIKNTNINKDAEFLILHVRPEPFLRLVKFYYKFLNTKGKLKHSLNIPFLKIVNPEKYDLLIIRSLFLPKKKIKNTVFYKFLIDLNYIIGKILGNESYALKKYYELIQDVSNYCEKEKIKFIILGPPLRTNTFFEKILSKRLIKYAKDKFSKKNIFIDGHFTKSKNTVFFKPNGIHANENYHNEISNKIFQIIEKS